MKWDQEKLISTMEEMLENALTAKTELSKLDMRLSFLIMELGKTKWKKAHTSKVSKTSRKVTEAAGLLTDLHDELTDTLTFLEED